MIKFFRKIRQKLLTENRFSKYLIYAIGEIVLVVIGILIALQINSWNAERLNGIKEKDYLSEIKENLKSDKINTVEVLEFNDSKIKAIDSTFALFGQVNMNDDYMSDFLDIGSLLPYFETFNPTKTTFDNLLSSDKIDIISNKKLRNSIVEYYSSTSNIQVQDIIKENTRNYVRNILPRIIDNKDVQKLMKINISFDKEDHVEIYKDRSVIASIRLMKANILVQNSFLENIDWQIDSLNKLIDIELK